MGVPAGAQILHAGPRGPPPPSPGVLPPPPPSPRNPPPVPASLVRGRCTGVPLSDARPARTCRASLAPRHAPHKNKGLPAAAARPGSATLLVSVLRDRMAGRVCFREEAAMEIDKDRLLWIYTRMLRIRGFEDRVHEEYAKTRVPGFVHLYAGEGAVAVGVCAHLEDRDFITSTHRGHGHCIAKGVDLKAMMAEVFGKATGACKGKGGSMHIADMAVGMLGANGIVGGGLPMATGAALAAQLEGKGNVAVCFFGDGAVAG